MTIADLPEYLETLTRRLENLEIELSVLKKPEAIETSIDINEAARFLGMKRQTVYQKVCNRKLPFYKSGRLLRFYKSELDNWLKGRK
ncbi:MAG TPA: helix-turn-helix domain-containing protein [Chitinophagaceae bacterium]